MLQLPQKVVDTALAERSFRLRPAGLSGALLDGEGDFVADLLPVWTWPMDSTSVTHAADPQVLSLPDFAAARWLFVTIPEAFEAGQVVQQARATRS